MTTFMIVCLTINVVGLIEGALTRDGVQATLGSLGAFFCGLYLLTN
jgi:hypothetical protein